MATAITFLKNYQKFGCKIRIITARTYYEKYLSTLDEQEKKIMFLRLYEENIASSEDLLYWTTALLLRNNYPSGCRDVWEFLLKAGLRPLTHEYLIGKMQKLAKVKKGKTLLKKFDLGDLDKFSSFGKMDTQISEKLLNELLKVMKVCLKNRKIKREILLRGHNKIKHGMMVLEEQSKLYIRDFSYKVRNTIVRRYNRNLILRIDDNKAKGMLGTISANCSAINILVTLFLFYYAEVIESLRGKKLTKKEKAFLEQSL